MYMYENVCMFICHVIYTVPKLNMAIPRPASEIIFIEYFIKLGIPTFHLRDPENLVMINIITYIIIH